MSLTNPPAGATPAPSSGSSGGGSRIPIPKSKRGFGGFLTDVRRELTKVSWPTVPETNRLTGVVLAVCGLLVVVLGIMGFVMDLAVRFIQGTH